LSRLFCNELKQNRGELASLGELKPFKNSIKKLSTTKLEIFCNKFNRKMLKHSTVL